LDAPLEQRRAAVHYHLMEVSMMSKLSKPVALGRGKKSGATKKTSALVDKNTNPVVDTKARAATRPALQAINKPKTNHGKGKFF
jgi:hypothetical protein